MPRKRAVIIGGSRGIGEAVRTELNARGWVAHDVSRSALDSVDVTDRARLDWAFEQIGAFGDVDALVYSAGHVDPAPLAEVYDAAWDYHLECNLTAAFRSLRWFIQRGKPGAVVFLASTAALRPSPGWGAYAATKAALVNLAHTANEELAGTGIRVYCVAPGRCATALRRVLAPEEDPATIMQPDEVATVIRTLLEDEAGVLAGQTIRVARS